MPEFKKIGNQRIMLNFYLNYHLETRNKIKTITGIKLQ